MRRRKKVKVKVVNIGKLGGKGATKKGVSHFVKKARRDYAGTIRALTNLERWNKNKKPSLSRWAKSMKSKVRRALGRAARKNPACVGCGLEKCPCGCNGVASKCVCRGMGSIQEKRKRKARRKKRRK